MAKKGDTRERLIDVTMHLMWADGYGGVSVDRICKAAGVNKGSFYHFFPSKEALALTTLDAIWSMAEEGFYKVAFDATLSPLERINRFAELTYAFHKGNATDAWNAEQGCPFGNIGAETGADTVAIRERVKTIYEAVGAYFEGAIADGSIHSPATDSRRLARRLVALQTGLLTHAKVYNDTDWFLCFLPASAAILGLTPTEDHRLPSGEPAPA